MTGALLVAGCSAALLLAGCGGGSTHSGTTVARTTTTASGGPTLSGGLHLSSPAFKSGHAIPRQYTCDGADQQLPVDFSGAPRGTRELLLVMRDPDAPTPDFVHWAVAGIPASATALPAPGAVDGRNSAGTVGYRGPCPPPGKPHHYVITLSALGGPSGLGAGFSASAPVKSAELAIATLVGTYARR